MNYECCEAIFIEHFVMGENHILDIYKCNRSIILNQIKADPIFWSFQGGPITIQACQMNLGP